MHKAEIKQVERKQAGELKMRVKQILVIGLSGFFLAACEGDKSSTLQDSLTADNTVDTISNYDLGNSVIPFPNDFLFAPDTGTLSDGTLNIPVDDSTDLADPKVAMNGLDGFSTVAPMSTGFTGAIDEGSISGDSVRVYPITKGSGLTGPATAVSAPLVFGVDYVAVLSSVDSTNSTLAILPLKPLLPKSGYAVVITNKLKSAGGRSVGISGSYALTRGATLLYDLTVPPAIPPSTAVAISDAIKSAILKPAPGATDEDIVAAGVSAATLETLRSNIVKPTEDAIIASDASLTSADIILHWTFSTQSTTDVLVQTRADIVAAAPVASAVLPVSAGDSPLTGVTGFVGATIHPGSIEVPYYLTAPTDTSDTGGLALDSFWHGVGGSLLTYLAGNVSPVATSTQTIPLLVTIPKILNAAACPTVVAGTWPVVIYQHGITTNRATALAVADSLANACFAVVAIDLPMHGITGNESTASIANLKGIGPTGTATLTERTFDLDLVKQDADGNTIGDSGDGVIDSSGLHFINLTNLQNTRDNVRQAVSDLFALRQALETMTVGANTFDTSRVYFLGHSLGAMVGTTFVANEPTTSIRDAAFAFGGASLAKILDGSAAFGPSIAAGLAVNGVIKGTADYESFIGAAQTVVDSGDPVNHAAAAATGRGILFFEIVGGASAPSDLVVPNTVPDGNDSSGTVPAPLAGTEAQLSLMGLEHVNASQGSPTSGVDLKVVTKFISGDHGSILLPDSDPAVTTEIQSEAATFFATDGFFLNVADDTVLLAP